MSAAPALNFSTKFSYGIGQLAEGVKNACLGTFVLFYYNQVLGLSGTLAGLAVAIALVFDAVSDPLAGSVSDNWHSRLGRRHPFMYASAIPLAISFALLFMPPSGFGETGLFIWLTATILLTRASMTLYHVPHIALGAELSQDYDERTQVVSFRYFFSFVGWLLAFYAGFGWFFADTAEYPRGQFNTSAYAPFAVLMSVIMAITIFWSAWGTRSRIPYLPPVPPPTETLKPMQYLTRMMRETIEALHSRSFLYLFGGVLLIFVMVGIDSALNLYMIEYFWELNSQQKTVLMLLFPVGIMIGSLLTPVLHRMTDKRTGILIGVTWWAMCQFVPVLLRFLGWFPENHTEWLPITLCIIKFSQGLAAAQSLVSFNSMIADIADQHELTTGKRQEGIFFAAGSFASKATSGVGAFFGGLSLDLIDWPRGDHIQYASDVPVETLASLGMVYGPIVSGFAVLSILLTLQCKMTRAGHDAVVAELDARRRAAAPNA